MDLSENVLTGEITTPFNGIDGKDGKDGKDGAAGKSAYEIACENGYEGSEKEWVESLGFIPDGTIGTEKLSEKAQEALEWKKNKGQPSGYAPLDEYGKIPEEFLYGTNVKEYGIRWRGTSDSGCERLGDAKNLVANAALGGAYEVKNDFDHIYPWCDMTLCNVDSEGNVAAYIGEPSFARDGSMGDVMVKIPKFYYKRSKTEDGCEEWWICGVKLPGYRLHPAFTDGEAELEEIYHSSYNAVLENGCLYSVSGKSPYNRQNRTVFRSYAKSKGDGWSLEDIDTISALQMLYAVEYADMNSQKRLGNGVVQLRYSATDITVLGTVDSNTVILSETNAARLKVGQMIEFGTALGNSDVSLSPRRITSISGGAVTFDGDSVLSIPEGTIVWNAICENGGADSLQGKSGYVGENGYADVSYRGIEGFHGKMFRFIDGINIRDYVGYSATRQAAFADGTYDGEYEAIGYTNAMESGFVKELGYDREKPHIMLPVTAGGTSQTYMTDNYTCNVGDRVLLYGGNMSQGGNAGIFCYSMSNLETAKSIYYGVHLILKKG